MCLLPQGRHPPWRMRCLGSNSRGVRLLRGCVLMSSPALLEPGTSGKGWLKSGLMEAGKAAGVARLVATPAPAVSGVFQQWGWAPCPPQHTRNCSSRLGTCQVHLRCPSHSYCARINFQWEDLAHWSWLPFPSQGPSHLGPKLVSSTGVRVPPVSHRPLWKGFKWHSGCGHVQTHQGWQHPMLLTQLGATLTSWQQSCIYLLYATVRLVPAV